MRVGECVYEEMRGWGYEIVGVGSMGMGVQGIHVCVV